MTVHNKTKTIIALKKARALIDKITTMVEKDEYCIDIMQQNLAAMGLLRSAHQKLTENHLNHCFKNAMESHNEKKKQQMINEIIKVANFANK